MVTKLSDSCTKNRCQDRFSSLTDFGSFEKLLLLLLATKCVHHLVPVHTKMSAKRNSKREATINAFRFEL